MPIVDYNRIYRVRSQERKPITNPVTGPDAAGAFLRGAVPAALAPMHGLNARINAIRGETDARNRRDALRLEGIASGIRAAGDAYQAYIRAMERRDAAELDKLEAAYTSYMLSGSDAAFSKPRKTEDGKVTDGPGAAIRQLDKDFEETDAYKAANRRVKDAFAPRREARRAVYFAKGDRAQFEAARTEHAQAVKDRAESDDVAVSKNLDPYNYRAWKEMTEIAIESDQHRLRLETGKFDVDADGREIQRKPLTQEELRKLEDKRIEKRDAYILQRAAYYGNLIAQDDGTLALTPHIEAVLEAIANNTGLSGGGQVEDDGMPDSDIAFANETVTDPLIRQKIGEILTNARQQRERNHSAAQGQIAREADSIIDSIRFGDVTGADFQTAQDKVRELVQSLDPAPDGSGVKLSGGAAKLLDDLDKAVADRELINFATEWNDAAWDFQKEDLEKRLRAMPEGRAKDAITKMLYGGATTGSTQQTTFGKSQASALLTHNQLNRHSARDVLEKAAAQLEADGDIVKFREVFDMVRSYMRFSDSCKDGTADHTDEYLSSIRGALEDAFGVKIGDFIKTDKNGNPVFDKDGNPVPAETDPDRKYRSTVGYREHFDYGRANRSNEGATRIVDSAGMKLANQTLQDSYSLATEFLTQRLNGFDGKGKKGGTAITPESARAELVELFREVLARQGTSLDEHLLQTTILSMRDNYARLDVPQATLDIADVTKIERAWNSGPAVAGGENAQGDDNR